MHRVEKLSPLLYISAVFLFLTISSFIALSSNIIAAEIPLISDVNLSVPASCGMNSTLDSPHSATITPGLYKDNIGTTTFNILCNDPGGFALYAIGYTDQTYGKTTLTATINGSVDHTHDISTSTATSGTTSSWSMKILKDGTPNNITIDNSYDNYNVIPTEYTKVASFTPTTTELVSQGTIKSTYASYMSTNQHTGTYDGKVKYTLIHPNDGTAPIIPGLLGITNMQDMTPEICTESAIGDEKQLIDSHDNKSYWVAKLADGGCWMTQNLDHDIDSTKTYTPNDTDIPANWTPDKSTYATGTTTWDTSTNGNGNNSQQSYDPSNKIWDGVATSTNNINLDNMVQGTNQHYHLGNYYNFGAAVAMNDTSSYTTQYTDVNQSICPKGWMLPKSGNITTAGSFQYLVNQYSGSNIWSAPLYFPLAGGWNGSSLGVAYGGSFRSSVVNWSSTAYIMSGNYSGTVNPAYGAPLRYNGSSVRCVAREAGSTPGFPTLSEIETMQEMNYGICATTAVGTEKQLRDTRDNKTYWVAKLQDGKCWMTQNLDLDLSTSKALTPSDSDVTSNWTPVRDTIDASAVTNNSISGWSDDNYTPYSVDPGNWYWNALPFYSSADNNFLAGSGGTKFQKNTPYANNGEHGHVGNYYNWSAAV
ncbi:hypothetical protein IKF57_01900, partial [Candidatus Saccharibacteria bacterium]|nr:hypothetical protein [Candidatus Saccharibacteria bacterium]